MKHVFVYGSLLFPEIVAGLTGKLFKTKKAILKNYSRYSVKGCDYPAIVPQKNAEVPGLLLFDVDYESLEILSFYEGDEYERKDAEIQCENEKIKALVFVWKGEPSNLLSEDWDEEKFNKESKQFYVDKVIPETIKEHLNR